MRALAPKPAVTNILIVGVGGQGVIMVSRVLAELCRRAGHEVKQSEVHGMAKRGGGVFSHLRFGPEVFSPTIPRGEADMLLALEWSEGLRWLNFLSPEGGTFIASTQQIVPPYSCRDRGHGAATAYQPESPTQILDRVGNGIALDATGMAQELGNQRVANTILLGAMSTVLDFAEADWLEVLASAVPPKTVELNHRAFRLGRARLVEAGDLPPPSLSGAPYGIADPEPDRRVQWKITAPWCKGCDICVKMCPERCLVLDHDQVAVLKDPDACTGCRICEWLCPDFAISVETSTVEAPVAAEPPRERVNAL